MSLTEFQFNRQQIGLLNEIKQRPENPVIQDRLRRGRSEYISKFNEILDDANFPDDDLSAEQISDLFWNMRRVMRNRTLGRNLYQDIGLQSFNDGLRVLFDEEISLPERIDQFMELGGIGRVTTSHLLFMHNPENYPLATKKTREVLELDSSQRTDAQQIALEFYNIDEHDVRNYRTIKLLGDFIIFSKIKDALDVDDYYAVNLLLWYERMEIIPETDEDMEEDDDLLVTSSREADLQDYLASNPDLIEPKLELIQREVPAGPAGRIDLLMKDENGYNVVIETKKGRSGDEVVSQISRYMGWISQNREGSVRGIIVVADADERLRLAVAPHPNLTLKYYRKYYRLSDNPFDG